MPRICRTWPSPYICSMGSQPKGPTTRSKSNQYLRRKSGLRGVLICLKRFYSSIYSSLSFWKLPFSVVSIDKQKIDKYLPWSFPSFFSAISGGSTPRNRGGLIWSFEALEDEQDEIIGIPRWNPGPFKAQVGHFVGTHPDLMIHGSTSQLWMTYLFFRKCIPFHGPENLVETHTERYVSTKASRWLLQDITSGDHSLQKAQDWKAMVAR